jgi:hypothetical protein
MSVLLVGKPSWIALIILVTISMSFVGCTSKSADSRKANSPPIIKSIVLGPVPYDLRADLTAEVQTQDADDDIVQVQYHWFLNDQPIGEKTSPVLSASLLKQGDHIRLEAMPFDGKVLGTVMRSELIEVGNTPPAIAQVGIGLKRSDQGDRLQALVSAVDRDHDGVQFRYRWRRNGSMVKEGADDYLDLTEVHSGDEVVLEVIPADDVASGKSVRSDPYLIENSPPKIISTPPTPNARDRYEYAVKAIDSDGDSMSYELEVAPQAMVIDKVSGLLSWNMSHVPGGTHRVKIVVSDGRGGAGYQDFDIALPSQASKPFPGT